MPTNIRPELSRKNKYWLERHRYYELKHFCLQYDLWKKERSNLDLSLMPTPNYTETHKPLYKVDATAWFSEKRIFYTNRIDMVERAAKLTDSCLGSYILKAVTRGLSYDILRVNFEIPCCKEVYYELYRKFFWILDRERG